jgi:hypothetical protein
MNARSATAIIAEIRGGQLVVEASQQIKLAIAAVREHGKAASVTIDIDIKPFKSGTEKLIEPPLVFVGTVSSKLPQPDVPATLMFVGEDGNATLNPPERQPDLGLSVAKDHSNKA